MAAAAPTLSLRHTRHNTSMLMILSFQGSHLITARFWTTTRCTKKLEREDSALFISRLTGRQTCSMPLSSWIWRKRVSTFFICFHFCKCKVTELGENTPNSGAQLRLKTPPLLISITLECLSILVCVNVEQFIARRTLTLFIRSRTVSRSCATRTLSSFTMPSSKANSW